jgi:hypothetical protein
VGIPIHERAKIASKPFILTRNAVAFSYAMSPHWGRCDVEFVATDGSVAASFSAVHTPGGDPKWREKDLRLSPGTYILRIDDQRDEGKFAITPPREMSLLGFIVRFALGHDDWLFFSAGLGLVISLSRPYAVKLRIK